MTGSKPSGPAARVSVIVPVRDRRDLLGTLLQALDSQTFTDFEVIIVDDGSTDGSDELAAGSVVAGRPVRLVRQAHLGAVAARQTGVECAEGEIFGFTDSDCAPSSGWIAAAIDAIDDGAALVYGETRPERPLRPLERSVAAKDDGLFATCNVFYRRKEFDAAGGFDEEAARRLGYPLSTRARGLGFGEDTLLGWRIKRLGADVRYVPEALVYHHVFAPDFVDSLNRCLVATAFPVLLAEVPELRATFIRQAVWFGSRRRLPMYATLVAAVGRRPRLAVLTAAWWAMSRYREMQDGPTTFGERIAALPQEMALDVATGLALVVGSIRARTLVL